MTQADVESGVEVALAISELERSFGPFLDLPTEVTVELGETTVSISELLELGPQSVIGLPKAAGEDLEIFINGRYVGKGAVIIIEEHFGIRITEIAKKICLER